LIKIYDNCDIEKNHSGELKNEIAQAKASYMREIGQCTTEVNNIHRSLTQERIKHRKFGNYDWNLVQN
jgi:hypothetical protein